MRRQENRGFTLVEVMIVVAIIAVLAAIVIPSFTRETRRSKAGAEVAAVFAELSVRQDQYKLENGAYLAAAACPAASTPTGTVAAACIASGGPWESLRVTLPSEKLLCSYTITAGTGTTTGSDNPSGFTFARPPGAWFYIIATCDGDGNSATNATYFTSSLSGEIQKQNEGQ